MKHVPVGPQNTWFAGKYIQVSCRGQLAVDVPILLPHVSQGPGPLSGIQNGSLRAPVSVSDFVLDVVHAAMKQPLRADVKAPTWRMESVLAFACSKYSGWSKSWVKLDMSLGLGLIDFALLGKLSLPHHSRSS